MSFITDRPSKPFIGAVEDEWQLYSNNSADYTLGLPIGFGSSSIVYTAIYHPQPSSPDAPPPPPTPCALKVLDLDSLPPHSLRLLKRETTLMSLSKHPNVLRVRGTWMDGHKLYIALRLMSKGSAADVMRYAWPGGMGEEVVRCILKQALEGLNYLHVNGFIHRDVKAANLLIDDDGTVLLGDLGVAANLAEDPDHLHSPKRLVNFDPAVKAPIRPRIGKRKSFVGTPCWMAPELIQGHQYDASADIWSFGITALELTQGRPPRSRESSQKVLLKIVLDPPPTLQREAGQYKYSRSFKEIVDSCLNKDPTKRPTAAELLATPFFKGAKKKYYLVGTDGILSGLPPLTQRQERRAKPGSGIAPRTVDSWDFLTTMRSPITSVVGHGRGSSGGHGRSPTGSSHSRTSSSTSVFGRNQVANLTGHSLTAGTLGGQVAEDETEESADARRKFFVLGDGNDIKPDDALKQRRGIAGRKLEASARIESSSTSSSPPSSVGCDGSSPPSSVCGAPPAPEAGVGSTQATPPSTRDSLIKPIPPPELSLSPSIWRKLTRKLSVQEILSSDGGTGEGKQRVGMGTLVVRKAKK